MYKELVISIIIVILIVSLDIYTQKYTDETVSVTTDNLYELKTEIQNNNSANEEILEKITDIYDEWQNYREKLVLYIEHNELEKVETDLVTCKSYIEFENYDLAVAELEKTVYVLKHINDKYEFTLENIF